MFGEEGNIETETLQVMMMMGAVAGLSITSQRVAPLTPDLSCNQHPAQDQTPLPIAAI